ncbi:hypothetical protein PIB30_017207 [Stylosanthes scabra]|uniref:Uncharacterized protein n=1 Tax=Stylosanthes scabra TaxID=79078 RepID=A0ABU6Y6K1_9FABA|nr:hypothetical protein [Stylosanthes scabra]
MRTWQSQSRGCRREATSYTQRGHQPAQRLDTSVWGGGLPGAADARAPTRQCCCAFRPGFRHRQWAVVHLRREMEAGDTHLPFAIRRGNYYTTGCRITLGITDGRRACWRLREGLPAALWEIDVADGSGYLGGEARAQRGGGQE